jgi:putative oxidoreductase
LRCCSGGSWPPRSLFFDAYLIVKEPDNPAALITQLGLPGHVAGVPLVMVLALCQLVGGIMLVFGFWTRFAALAFAAFCVATAVLVHHNFASSSETIQAGKDVAIAGGFLFLAGSGPGSWSLDGRSRV